MDVVWSRGPSTVAEVAEALPDALDLAYNTVLTTMRILEEKGYLRHTKTESGRAFVYHAVVERKEASRNAIKNLLGRFFDGSPEELVLNLLEDEQLSSDEITRIRERIRNAAAPTKASNPVQKKAATRAAGKESRS